MMRDFGKLLQHGSVIFMQGEAWRRGYKEDSIGDVIGVSVFMYSNESGA